MMPILHSPGVMTPGQFGPTSRDVSWESSTRRTLIMSATGMPSVIAMTSAMPASTASRMASAAKGGGTKIAEALAPVFSTASATVSKTGTSSSNF